MRLNNRHVTFGDTLLERATEIESFAIRFFIARLELKVERVREAFDSAKD
jgi:hypothetical protein